MSRFLPSILGFVVAVFLAAAGSPAQVPSDPRAAEVPLPARGEWSASLIHAGGDGIWTVGVTDVFPQHGCPEVFGLDDAGRCLFLASYSGKWTPFVAFQDRAWLGALAKGEIDAARSGPEYYVGGRNGVVHQVRLRARATFEARPIAVYPGEEIHTLVAGDLDPAHAGEELLVFTGGGGVSELRAPADPAADFALRDLGRVPGRVRQALLLPPATEGGAPTILAVTRSGHLLALRLGADGLDVEILLREPMGLGRIARSPGAAPVFYLTRDDGVVLRAAVVDGAWTREVIYAGPQGPRGIAAGRFDADPEVETVAVFGYSRKVQLLSRRAGEPWRVEDVFVDHEKGHWICAAELDGRNATDELVCSGYGGRIILLARPPGYGRPGVPIDPATERGAPPADAGAEDEVGGDGEASESAEAGPDESPRPPRIAVSASSVAATRLTTLAYRGGFLPKTLVYETLVGRAEDGRIRPGLAESWEVENEGRRFRFILREGARWHDDREVRASDVAMHFRRWVGLPEHDWIPAGRFIRAVRAEGPRELVIDLDRPHDLLADLCAINPTAAVGPAALTREGEFVAPIGSGPWRFVEAREDGRVLRLARCDDEDRIVDLVRVDRESRSGVIEGLARGDVDALVEGGDFALLPSEISRLSAEPGLEVRATPGSAVTFLVFSGRGATADPHLRLAVAAALDRRTLCGATAPRPSDPCASWAAPIVAGWPRGNPGNGFSPSPRLESPLAILARPGEIDQRRLADVLVEQLARVGIPARILAAAEDEARADLSFDTTWGLPYDPELTLASRFGTPADQPTAADRPDVEWPELRRLVDALGRATDEDARAAARAAVQAELDRSLPIVPLLVARRLAVHRRAVSAPLFGANLYEFDPSPLVR